MQIVAIEFDEMLTASTSIGSGPDLNKHRNSKKTLSLEKGTHRAI